MFAKKTFFTLFFCVGLSYYWMNYVKRGPVYESEKRLLGKTVLITGGNTGIGKITALELAKRGARVIIASRNVAKSEVACQYIIKESGNSNVFAKKLDLMDFDNVRDFAQWFIEKEEHLDYLINNAGIMDIPGRTKSGINKLFAVNHFGHFLLTNLLLDKMKAQSRTRPVRIINVSSEAYKVGSLTEEIVYEDSVGIWRLGYVYGATKEANIYFTTELHNRLGDYDITVYSVHPGAVATELGHKFSDALWKKIIHQIVIAVFQRDPFYGAQTILYCALDDEVVKQSGGYFKECSQRSLLAHATNETLGKQLWKQSLKITGLAQ